jgi:hypothetical protein
VPLVTIAVPTFVLAVDLPKTKCFVEYSALSTVQAPRSNTTPKTLRSSLMMSGGEAITGVAITARAKTMATTIRDFLVIFIWISSFLI